MSSTSCPVAVEGWGGAGYACESALAALDSIDYVLEVLRAAYPEQWRSVAADGYTDRLEDLIAVCRRVRDSLAEVGAHAQQLAAEVVAAHTEAG